MHHSKANVQSATWLGCPICSIHSSAKSTSRARIAPVASDSVDDLPVQRGDWIEVQGLGLCCVRRVHQSRRGLAADVECASDLSERSVDLDRRRWRKVER